MTLSSISGSTFLHIYLLCLVLRVHENKVCSTEWAFFCLSKNLDKIFLFSKTADFSFLLNQAVAIFVYVENAV